jgi:DeoR/GlpR family transcriptional regulator of sugar metabolism
VAGPPLNGVGDAAAAPSLARRHRQQRIAEQVLEQGSITVDALVRDLKVSRMTVHRELDELERQGILRKIRGGATAERSRVFESDVQFRLRTALREKQALADYALTLLEPGQVVLLDSSTTVLPMARRLAERAPLTVITHSLAVMRAVSQVEGLRLIAVGGEYLAHYDAFVGLHCERAIGELRADLCVLSPSAVCGGDALHAEPQIVAMHQAALRVSQRRVLLADGSKVGKAALHRVAPLADFDIVAVDDGAPEAAMRELRDTGIELHVVSVAG